MSTLDEITKEKQRVGEALARVDAQHEKLAGQLGELEAAERVLARYSTGTRVTKKAGSLSALPQRRRRDRRARCRRPTTPMAASSRSRAAGRRSRARVHRRGRGSANAVLQRRPFRPALAVFRAPPETTPPPRCDGPRPEPCRRQIRCRKAPARRRSRSRSSARVRSAAGPHRRPLLAEGAHPLLGID